MENYDYFNMTIKTQKIMPCNKKKTKDRSLFSYIIQAWSVIVTKKFKVQGSKFKV
jgi:hypothetical protein